MQENMLDQISSTMDIQTMMICIAVVIISALLIYFIMMCTMREKSYDDVMREQQQRLEKERLKTRQHGHSEKKDKSKTKVRQRKAKVEKVEEKVVEAYPELIKLPTFAQPKIEPVKVQKSKKGKPEEAASSGKQAASVSPVVREGGLHKTHVSEGQRQEKVAHDMPPSKEVRPVAEVQSIQEEIRVEEIKQVQATVQMRETKSKSRKVRAVEPSTAETVSVDGQRMLEVIQSTKLTIVDVRTIIEVLSVQTGASDWTKKMTKSDVDPVLGLKKQLSEKEKALQEEQSRAMAANTQVKALKQELAQENQKYAQLEKHSHDRITSQSHEIEALHARMQATHDQHTTEVQTTRMQLDQLKASVGGEDQRALVAQLRSENKQLKETMTASQVASGGVDIDNLKKQLKIMQDELTKNVLKTNAAENLKKNMDSKINGYKDQIAKLEAAQRDTEAVLSKKLNETTEELRRESHKAQTIRQDMEKMKQASGRAEQELAALQQKMQGLEAARAQDMDNLTAVQKKLKEAEVRRSEAASKVATLELKAGEEGRVIAQKDQELQQLMQENASMMNQLDAAQKTTVSAVQQSAGGADVNAEQVRAQLEQQQKLMSENDMELERVRAELAGRTVSLQTLQDELDTQRKKNDTLRNRNWKVMDALAQAEKRADNSIQLGVGLEKKTLELTQVSDELQRVKKAVHELERERTAAREAESMEAQRLKAESVEAQRLRAEMEVKTAQLEKVQGQLDEMCKEHSALQQRSVAQQAAGDMKATSQLTSVQSELEQANGQLKAVRAEVEQLKQQNQKLADESNAKVVQLKGELEGRSHEVETFRTQCDALGKQNKEKVELASSEAEKSAQELSTLREQLKNRENDLLKLQDDLKVAQTEKEELVATVAASVSADDAAVEVTRLRQCLECKESELEIMQGWLSKGEQATKDLESERQRADELAGQLSKSCAEVGELREQVADSATALDTLQQQLKTFSQQNEALGAVKEQMQQVSVRSESLAAQVSTLELTLQTREAELNMVKKENQELLAGCREATETLTKAESAAEGIALVQAELKEKVLEVDHLEAQLKQKEAEIAELWQQQSNVQPQVAAPVAVGPSELHGKEYTTFTRVEERSSIDVSRILNDLDTTTAELTILQAVLTGKEKQIEGLQHELEQRQTSDLVNGNVVSPLTVEVEQLHRENTEYQEQIEELNKRCQSVADKPAQNDKEMEEQRRLLQRLFPSVSVDTTSTQKEWVTSFEKQATQYLQQLSNTKPSESSPDVEAQLVKERQAGNKLQSEVAHYKGVLAETEAILQQLQNSVEQEEQKWSIKVSQSEQDLQQKQAEVGRLQDEVLQLKGSSEEVTDLDFAYRCVEKSLTNIVDELKEKIVGLEVKLAEAESEKMALKHQLTEKQGQDIDQVLQELEVERKSKKELALAKAKLSGMLKTGQDALKEEQDLVRQLQEQLEVHSKVMPNGTNTTQDLEQLRQKLADTEKQLEQETQAKKQLAQKLDASAATDDMGTAV